MIEDSSRGCQLDKNGSFDFTAPSTDSDDSSLSFLRRRSLVAIESTSSCEESELERSKSFCFSSSQKLSKAAVSIPPIDHVSYVHGGYAAVAPLFVDDTYWMNVLQLLMPEAHSQLMKLIKVKSPFGGTRGMSTTATGLAHLMNWAQTNPVVAAYGVLQGYPYRPSSNGTTSTTSRIRTKVPNTTPIEWDVFLDPLVVQDVDKALQTQTDVETQLIRLMSRMLLSHGSVSQLMVEALGVAPKFNFSKLAAQASTATSAIFLTTWLQLFLSALQHGRQQHAQNNIILTTNDAANSQVQPDQIDCEEQQPYFNNNFCGFLLCTENEDVVPRISHENNFTNTLKQVLREIKEILGGTPLQVVLDLKSRSVPPRVWAGLIDTLLYHGLRVHGVGTFNIDEARAIVQECTASSSIIPIIFFHSAGDLQRACHANKIKRGDTVYFNGGSLLWQKPSVLKFATAKASCLICSGRGAGKEYLYSDTDELSTRFCILPFAHPRASLDLSPAIISSSVDDYKKYYDLNIGLYVQEFSICQEALELLIHFVNFNSDTYNLGIAYGGLNGATVSSLCGDGFWNQRYIGRNWDSKCSGPTGYLEPDFVEDNEMIREAIVAGGAIGALYYEEDEGTHTSVATCLTSEQNPYDDARF